MRKKLNCGEKIENEKKERKIREKNVYNSW